MILKLPIVVKTECIAQQHIQIEKAEKTSMHSTYYLPCCNKNDIKIRESKNKLHTFYFKYICPLPMFLISISTLEGIVFVYDYLTVNVPDATSLLDAQQPTSTMNNSTFLNNQLTGVNKLASSNSFLSQSVLVYRPDRRLEIWRFLSYMLLHANWFHLVFNILIQLLYGLPLEFIHGSLRIALIYFAGVFAGSLGTSVMDPTVYLLGASSGVYALMTAQLANILLNFDEIRHGLPQMISVLIFVCCDFGYFLIRILHKYPQHSTTPTISYNAHLTGSLAGFTMGLLVLKRFAYKSYLNILWWLALSIYLAFTTFGIVFNLLNTMTAQLLKENDNKLIRQYLLNSFLK